jgi:hypothetical protein
MALEKGYRQLLDEARSKIRTLSVGEARARLADGDAVFKTEG